MPPYYVNKLALFFLFDFLTSIKPFFTILSLNKLGPLVFNFKNGRVNPCVYPTEAFRQTPSNQSTFQSTLSLKTERCITTGQSYIGKKEGPSGLK